MSNGNWTSGICQQMREVSSGRTIDVRMFEFYQGVPRLNIDDINYDLLLPILVHRVDDQGLPCSDQPARRFCARRTQAFQPVVEAMRQYWKLIRYGSDA
jgi:hypothetical protein